ncbi:MAG: HAMP domain-containing histidine kinase [Sulfuritalea sp.]|nr:HAMP domain-containing histidine kinase [Sulfuritalea sp.]
MTRRHSLRFRVAIAFAGLGAALGLLLIVGIWFAAHDVSRRLLDQTLKAELDDYMARRARNPNSLPPASAGLRGYHSGPGAGSDTMPARLRELAPGQHAIELDGIPWRAAVADDGSTRYVILFDEQRQQRRERRFLGYLLAAAALVTLLATLGGMWLAARVIAPVTELARAVTAAAPERPPQLAGGDGAKGDEIDELAHAFDRYLARLAKFVERERRFANDASHELRTPLAVIRGAADVLAEDPALQPAQRERVARIQRAATEMAELTAALLLLAREPDARDDERCDARRLALDCTERYRPLAAARGTRLVSELPPALELQAPAALFAMVLTNLLHNAVAHTRDGEIRITLDARQLCVTDNGSGIDAADLGRVFEHHYRGPESTGAGIGLSLVRRIGDRLGWSVELDSVPSRGTTAVLRFAQS